MSYWLINSDVWLKKKKENNALINMSTIVEIHISMMLVREEKNAAELCDYIIITQPEVLMVLCKL